MPQSSFRAKNLEHGIIIRDIVNENNSAEKELEDYFNVEE